MRMKPETERHFWRDYCNDQVRPDKSSNLGSDSGHRVRQFIQEPSLGGAGCLGRSSG